MCNYSHFATRYLTFTDISRSGYTFYVSILSKTCVLSYSFLNLMKIQSLKPQKRISHLNYEMYQTEPLTKVS